jgi:hypothetical protein
MHESLFVQDANGTLYELLPTVWAHPDPYPDDETTSWQAPAIWKQREDRPPDAQPLYRLRLVPTEETTDG